MSMFGRDLLGNVRMRIVHFDFIYAQKDSFAHRYGFSEICGCVPLDLGCFGPVARSRRALTSGARRAAVSEAVCLPAGPLARWSLVAGRWSAGDGRCVSICFSGSACFLCPHFARRPGADPGGIARTLRLQLPAARIYIPRRADSVDYRTQKKFVTK